MTAPPVVVLRRLPEAIEEMAKLVEVALASVVLPCTRKFPEVVAPPEMVRPPACAPFPIVEDAVERRPVDCQRDEVALAHFTVVEALVKTDVDDAKSEKAEPRRKSGVEVALVVVPKWVVVVKGYDDVI